MKILTFAATNHKSIRDRMELDLTRPSLTRLQPTDGQTWDDVVHPVAGIFGPNASGKTAIIDAMSYLRAAVLNSAAGWAGLPMMPREPFKLDAATLHGPSTYELAFVHDAGVGATRYEYTFTVSPGGVENETLIDIPAGRRRTIFTRHRGAPTRFARGFQKAALHTLAPRELLLSRALVLGDPQLAPIAAAITEGIDIVPLGDHHRQARLGALMQSLSNEETDFAELVALLQVADIGVTDVDVREEEAPPAIREFFTALRRLDKEEQRPPAAAAAPDTNADIGELIARTLEFRHRGSTEGVPPLNLEEESSGTIAWLALAVPALDVLRRGGVLLVDELDASLHTHLAEVFLQLFTAPHLNNRGGQLVFTGHDTHVLATASSVGLDPGQVWFTEKSRDGATDLYSLADFRHDRGENVAKRYLAGRYGAVPRLAPSLIDTLVHAGARPAPSTI